MSDNTVLEEIRNLAVGMGLIVIYEAATPERGHVLSLFYGKTCLHRTSDLSTVEHYLWGFRDGRTTPVPEMHEALALVRNVNDNLGEIFDLIPRLRSRLDDADGKLVPFTRERS